MKINILVIALLSLVYVACNQSNSHEGHNHDVESHEGHNHDDHEGHNHDEESHEGHDHGDHEGHDHDNDDHDHDDHDHGDESLEGNDHSDEESSHTDEISFTKEQAQMAGLATESIALGTFHQVIKTSGKIQASQGDEATLVATSNGIVSFVNPSIAEGDYVKSGEVIITVSAKQILNGDPVEKAKIAFETAEKEMKRADELIGDQIISVKEYEQIKMRYKTAKTTYQAQSTNSSVNGVKIASPISGYIKNRLVAQGEYVSVGQSIATISQNQKLQLKAEVSEKNYKSLKNISNANFKTAYDNTLYKLSDLNGRLLSYGRTSGQQSFYVPITFEFDNIGDLIPGSFTEIYLIANPQNNVITAPVSSLTEEQGLYFAYIQVEEEIFKKQEVTLGQNDGERVHILSGLKEGDKVVTNGVYQVKLAATSSVMPEGHGHSH
ncbi:efflux RND transporter periplasmic adaptor subunit [Carboxylicivirga sp. N1Y90]|uniref:efflux RND transporter periplasmic adaptor subunit n=1 Tax=Carboxylicivirga fragile TaxID=3417571 RepID=UPI003D336AB0|nr:efflux RND transporter periplasmic adaptor subunit [Marinilabiliaceae bacterium N1Y90]